MGVDEQIYATASRRRRAVANAFSFHFDVEATGSTAQAFLPALFDKRTMIVSGDIDGLVTACMLASVAPGWRIGAFVRSSSEMLAPDGINSVPGDAFGVDIFSLQFDCISNHPVLYGPKNLKNQVLREALRGWDSAVHDAARDRIFVAPSLWVGTTSAYEDAAKIASAKYKYPLGSAQVTLALLEAIGLAPKFYDRTFLPWLIANSDGGAESHGRYAWNTSVWWPIMAAVVGPSSMSERIFERVDAMRPLELRNAINGLRRERAAENLPQVLRDDWSLPSTGTEGLLNTLRWLTDLAVWPDPILGGMDSLSDWKVTPVSGSGLVYIDSSPPAKKKPSVVAEIDAKKDPALAAASLRAAESAINANFYTGGVSGSRFNWIGGF